MPSGILGAIVSGYAQTYVAAPTIGLVVGSIVATMFLVVLIGRRVTKQEPTQIAFTKI